MKIVLLGPPGSGKGTQGEKLSALLGVPHIVMGDIIREVSREESELGNKVKSYLNKGLLVPNKIVIELLKKKLRRRDCEGFILDGYPRTTVQAEALEEILKPEKLDLAIYLNVDEKEIIKRISYRRQCPKCGMVYHLLFNPPKKDEICNKCGSKLFQREDDKEEIVKKRIMEYRKKTEPLINYYREKGILEIVDGNKSIDEVFRETVAIVKKWMQ